MKILTIVLCVVFAGCASNQYPELTPEQEAEIGHECALKNSVDDIHDFIVEF